MSLIDVGGTSTGTEAILGDSTHAMPVKIMAGSTALSVSGSTINVNVVSISGTTSQAVTLTTASTLSVNVSNTVGISVTTASSLHADTELPAAAALADNTANPTAPAVASFPHVWDSTQWDRWPGSSALGGKVYTTTDSTIHATISALTTASTIHANVSGSSVAISALTTASTIHVAQSGTWTIAALTTASTVHVTGTVSVNALTTASTIHIAPLTTASTIHVAAAQSGTWSLTTATTINVVITAGGGTGGTAGEDNEPFAASSGLGTPMFGYVSATTVTTGNVGAVGMLTNRQLKVTLFDSAGSEQAVGGGTQYTIGTTGSTGNTGTVSLGYRKDTPATYADTTGDLAPLEVDSEGKLWVNTSRSTQPVTLTTASTLSVNVSNTVTITALTTASTVHAQVNALTTASTIHVAQSGTWTIAALTTASTVHAQVNALTTASTIHVAQSGTWTIAALTTASTVHAQVNALTTASTIHIAPLTLASTINVIAVAGTSGGVTPFNKVGSTVFESTTIKLSAGQVYGISGYNNTLNPIYVKLYESTAAPTTSQTARLRFMLPATTVTGAAGFVEDYACPVAFATGIGIRITGGSILDAATEAAASTASLYTVNVRYS